MKLIKLTIQNFKGIKERTIDLAGGSLKVWGQNATGKTTLKTAFLWLVTGKDEQNRADFAMKPRDEGGERHNLVTMVEGVFDTVALKKEVEEKWTKKRGSSERVFEGHTTTYSIDGVPVKEKDYKERIASIAPEQLFRVLTDTAYFCDTMHYTDRRRMLADMAGIDTARITELEKDKERVRASIKKMKEEVDALPVRIDEANKALPEEVRDRAEVEQSIGANEKELLKATEAVTMAENGGGLVELKKKERELTEEQAELVRQDRKKDDEANEKRRAGVRPLQDAYDKVADAERQVLRLIDKAKDELKREEPKLETLRKEYKGIAAEEFVPRETCSLCGQKYPEEKLATAREEWNTRHAKLMDDNTREGKAIADRVKSIKAELALAEEAKEKATAAVKKAQDDIDAFGDAKPTPAHNPRRDELDGLIHKAGAAIIDARRGIEELVDKARAKKRDIEEALKSLRKDIAVIDGAENTRKRIAKLTEEQAALSERYAKLEQELMSIEQKQRDMAREVEAAVNDKFKSVRFALFRERINGGLEEICDPLINGVPYSSANNAARINAGLEIIETIGEYWGLSFPIFVDNAEAVVDLYPIKAQTIELIVSAKDKKMNIVSV